jgi:hypothetical protein
VVPVDFIALYSVELPMVRPVRAARGNIIAIHPAHATANVVVCANRPGFPVLRTAFVELGALYGMVLMWEADGVIRFLAGDLPARRPLRSAPGIAG